LLAVLCRAINIPDGLCYQKLKRTSFFTGVVLHSLTDLTIIKANIDRLLKIFKPDKINPD